MAPKALSLTAAVLGTLVRLLHGQAPDQKPLAFAAASIKQSAGPRGIGTVSPDRFFRPNTTLLLLLTYAYDINVVQIQGGDPWTRDSRFYVDARAEGRPTEEQMRAMVREMLAERFHLKTHMESRETPRYALVKARSDGRLGDRLRRSPVDCRAVTSAPNFDVRQLRSESHDPSMCTRLLLRPGPSSVTMTTHGYPISDFASTLQARVGRFIVDKTGLTVAYDIDFESELPTPMPGLAPPPDAQPTTPREGLSVFTALEEQLGLKLESERGPVDVLVIDHVEKPTPD